MANSGRRIDGIHSLRWVQMMNVEQSNRMEKPLYRDVPSTRDAVCRLLDEAIEFLKSAQDRGVALHVSPDEYRLVIDEALENALRHGNMLNPEKRIRMMVSICCEQHVMIIVQDEGEGFDVNTIIPLAEVNARYMRCGRGIHLLRKMGRAKWIGRGNIIRMIV